MTRLAFLSPANAAPGVAIASPLAGAITEGIVDVSGLGKVELRGSLDAVRAEPDEELLRLGPGRALLVTGASPRAALERLHGGGVRAYDVTAALAAFEVEGEDLLRRLTELDLERLPAIGSVARGIPAVIERRGETSFRLFVPQELGRSVVEVVSDTLRGLGR